MIIDAKDLILGRLATKVAKLALLGERIDIVNSEKAIITGTKEKIVAAYKRRLDRTVPLKGPYISRLPDRIVRRTIRGMLPYKKEKGEKAFKRIMCHIGVPDEFKDKKFDDIGIETVAKVPNLKFVTVGFVAKQLGAKFREQ